jgi:branched-chain amino acid transport system permease protein
MGIVLSNLANGLAVGSVYAILALGFTLVFGVAGLINFAQGSLLMAGAFLTWTGTQVLDLPLLAAAGASVVLVAVLGLTIDVVARRPREPSPVGSSRCWPWRAP